MSAVTTEQFVTYPNWVKRCDPTGIPAGYVLGSYKLPTGWTFLSSGAISGGTQDVRFTCAIGSGTIVLKYTKADSPDFYFYEDVYSNATRMGEEIIQEGVIFVPPVILPAPIFCEDNSDCVFSLNVFADPDDSTNFNNNDKSEFYFTGNAGISAITLTLQQYILGAWQDVETITDNSLGNFFPFGKCPDFSGNDFTDDFNKKYTGIFLEWYKVYSVYGIGNYRMKITQTDIFSETTYYYSKAEYCLKKWNCANTDGTVKIETLNQGLRGTLNDMNVQIDYYTGWKGEIRLKGIFKQGEPSYNKEYNQYGDSDFNSFKPIIDEQVPKYKVQLDPVPGWIDWYISTNVLQADQTLITDYNSKQRNPLVQVPVKDGNMKLLEQTYANPLAIIEIEFVYGRNNLRKRNSF